MNVELSTRDGVSITKFTDLEGVDCSFQEYLKARGLYSSQFYIYLKTELKESSKANLEKVQSFKENVKNVQSSEENLENVQTSIRYLKNSQSKEITAETSTAESQFLVDGKIPQKINVKYTKVLESAYNSDKSYLTSQSMVDCWEVGGSHVEFEEYNPCLDGFKVTSIAIGGKTFFEFDLQGKSIYHQPAMNDGDIFVYPPHILNGFEAGKNYVILAAVLKETFDYEPTVHWYKDNLRIMSGKNLTAIKVCESGQYTCGVDMASECKVIYPAVNVTTITECTDMNTFVGPSMVLPLVTSDNLSSDETEAEFTAEQKQRKRHSQTKCEVNVAAKKSTPETISNLPAKKSTPETISNLPAKKSTPETISNLPVKKSTPETISNLPAKKSTPETISNLPAKKNTPETISNEHEFKNETSDTTKCSQATLSKISISDITFKEEIGRGAFGVVKKAEWLGTAVAVKEITVRRMKLARPLIQRELDVHSSIRHPNILQLLAYGTEGNKLFLITELIDGNNLDEIIFGGDSTPTWDYSIKLSVAVKIIQAVAYLHNQNPVIIHRDIKPENVLVSKDLQVVRLCDMGLSKLKTFNTVVTTVASSDAAQPGTPFYQAPEVLVERKSANIKTDIWSLSCTLIELIIEEPVWSGIDDDELISNIQAKMKIQAMPAGLESLLENKNVPVEISKVLYDGLSYCAAKRPSALDVLRVFKKKNFD